MLILLDDNGNDLKMLSGALAAQGIPKNRILQFSNVDQATKALSRKDRKTMNALAIISDLALGDEFFNGLNFLIEQFHNFTNDTGGGVWAVLISIDKNLQRRDFSAIHPLPHWTYDKNNANWPEICARDVKTLLFSQLFEFDEANDFAPPPELNIATTDRIYLYSSDEAAYLAPNLTIDAEKYFIFRQVKKGDKPESNPILMYRGHYIYTSRFKKTVSPKLVRILLRWRTAALACAGHENRGSVKEAFGDSISFKHICSWRSVSDNPDPELDEERGFPIKSVNNEVGGFRSDPEVKKLGTLLFPGSKNKIFDGFPSVRSALSDLDGKLTRKDGVLRELRLPLLSDEQGVEDNFLTRIHFVLSAQEVQNYNKWKKEWSEYFLNPS